MDGGERLTSTSHASLVGMMTPGGTAEGDDIDREVDAASVGGGDDGAASVADTASVVSGGGGAADGHGDSGSVGNVKVRASVTRWVVPAVAGVADRWWCRRHERVAPAPSTFHVVRTWMPFTRVSSC